MIEVRPLLVLPQDNGHVFLTDYGEFYTGSTLGRMIKKRLQQAGIEKTGGCHLFCHAMTTYMLENGADIRFIQVMLGHVDLTSTQEYTHVAIEKLREIYNASHPTAKSTTMLD